MKAWERNGSKGWKLETKDITHPSGFSIYTSNGAKMDFGDVTREKAGNWENHGQGAILGMTGNMQKTVLVEGKETFRYPSL